MIRQGRKHITELEGLADAAGAILLPLDERRVAEDRRDCCWLYIVTNCGSQPEVQEPTKDPAGFLWHEVTDYYLSVDAITGPSRLRKAQPIWRVEAITSFRIADPERQCRSVGIDMIRRVLKNLRTEGRVECLARVQDAQGRRRRIGNNRGNG